MADDAAQRGALRNSMPVMNWAKQDVGESEQRQSLRRSVEDGMAASSLAELNDQAEPPATAHCNPTL